MSANRSIHVQSTSGTYEEDHGAGYLLDLIAQRPEWHQNAACRGVSPELMYPGRGESIRPAKAVCADCPVQQECLDWALTNNEKNGVWGNASERERRRMRRNLKPGRPARNTCINGHDKADNWSENRNRCLACQTVSMRRIESRRTA